MNRKSAVYADPSLPEKVCGPDERVQVNPLTSPPYSSIASLEITARDGTQLVGSGFEINLPNVQQRVIVTSGHVTYTHVYGGYAQKIGITFPGQQQQTATTAALFAPPQWVANHDRDYDYGVILLPGQSGGFGWSCLLSDSDLGSRLVSNCGYPGDKPPGTLWATGGPINSITAERLFYMNDTMAGQSGSPVWTWWKGYWTCVGVHSYGGCPNSAPRFTTDFISQILTWAGYSLLRKSIGSVQFPGVIMRMDGRDVTAPVGTGGGYVNCQFTPPGPYELFNVIPLEMPPSLATQAGLIPYGISSVQFPGVIMRMDGRDVTAPSGTGGGYVNCQFTPPGPYERFNLVPNGNNYIIGSVQFPGVIMRMDGRDVTAPNGTGGGYVNCQFTPPGPYELFSIS